MIVPLRLSFCTEDALMGIKPKIFTINVITKDPTSQSLKVSMGSSMEDTLALIGNPLKQKKLCLTMTYSSFQLARRLGIYALSNNMLSE